MSYVSPAARERLTRPVVVYRSKPKVVFWSLLSLGAAIGLAYVAWSFKGDPQKREYWIGGVAAALFVVFLVRWAPKLISLGRPVLVLSAEGIEVPGKGRFPWDDVIENAWVTASVLPLLGFPSHIDLQTQERDLKIEALTLAISGKEYLRLCSLYAGLHAHGGASEPAVER
jgi:hypothetical protein